MPAQRGDPLWWRVDDDVQRRRPGVEVAADLAFDDWQLRWSPSVTTLTRRAALRAALVLDAEAGAVVVVPHLVRLAAFETRDNRGATALDRELANSSDGSDHLLRN